MEDQIAVVAYFKWIDAGRPEGRDVEFWLEAEKEVVSDYTFTKPVSAVIRKNGSVYNIAFVKSWADLLVRTLNQYVAIHGSEVVRRNIKSVSFSDYAELLVRPRHIGQNYGSGFYIETKCTANQMYNCIKHLAVALGDEVAVNVENYKYSKSA
jgi:hypothetical protein